MTRAPRAEAYFNGLSNLRLASGNTSTRKRAARSSPASFSASARDASSRNVTTMSTALVTTDGGFDFTGADCARWMQEAGFQRIRTEPLVDGHSMVVGFK